MQARNGEEKHSLTSSEAGSQTSKNNSPKNTLCKGTLKSGYEILIGGKKYIMDNREFQFRIKDLSPFYQNNFLSAIQNEMDISKVLEDLEDVESAFPICILANTCKSAADNYHDPALGHYMNVLQILLSDYECRLSICSTKYVGKDPFKATSYFLAKEQAHTSFNFFASESQTTSYTPLPFNLIENTLKWANKKGWDKTLEHSFVAAIKELTTFDKKEIEKILTKLKLLLPSNLAKEYFKEMLDLDVEHTALIKRNTIKIV